MSDIIDKLTEMFMQFPGIGPRQAKRFVYFLLRQDAAYAKALIESIDELREDVTQCKYCFRYYIGKNKVCDLCADPNREQDTLLVVEKDIDLENVRKTGKFHGQYFVLGGLLPILEKNPESRIRISELRARLTKDKNLKEVILAISANAIGDNTVEFLQQQIKNLPAGRQVKVSTLGRGLSTGTELEYSDSDTLSAALESRK